MPTTAFDVFSSGPPESPGSMSASVWMRPVRSSGLLPSSSVAVMLLPSPVTWPGAALGVPPVPPALPTPTTSSPTETVPDAVLTVSIPDAPSSCTTATSVFGATPTTWAS